MDTRETQLTTADGPMALYEAIPDREPGRAIVVVQEAFGVNDHMQDVTRRLAAEGYHAVAPAFFHRAGGGTAPYDDFTKVMPLFEGLSDDGILIDFDAALVHLHDAGFSDDHIGLVGFCFGGRISFLVAARRHLGAAVGFYGGGIVKAGALPFPPLIGETASLQTPWLGLFGDLDHGIPVDEVEELRTALSSAPVDAEVVRYANAGHGFHCNVRDGYVADAAAAGWRRTLDWFSTHLAS